MANKGIVTSESVGYGHPDKICDQISDAVLDALLAQDPSSRVAVNASIKNNKVWVFGEVTSKAKVDYSAVALGVLRDIGLKEEFHISVDIVTQSPDIAMGVDTGGAGDQGTMVGYATNETEDYMPPAIHYAHKIMGLVEQFRREGSLPEAGPDMKCQVTVRKICKTDPFECTNYVTDIVLSVQHSDDYNEKSFKMALESIVSHAVGYTPANLFINNTGKFVVGGSYGDSGLTGRKIIVDSYGGVVPHGGGAFSGKDCTKVDRSAAYAARWIAKNIVAAELADQCEIELSYAIGKAEPIMITVSTFGTGKVYEWQIEDIVRKNFPLTPKWIREKLDLRRPIYRQTAVLGHFGRNDLDLPWENLDLVKDIKKEMRKWEKKTK
jgi:S-adenosylmethionine synthetase